MHILKHNAAFLIWELQAKLKSSDWKFEMLISEPQIHRIVSLLILPQFFENHDFFLLFIKKNHFFICIYFLASLGLCSLCGLPLVAVSGGYGLRWCVGFSLRGFSCGRAQTPGHTVVGSCSSWALGLGLSSCGAWT